MGRDKISAKRRGDPVKKPQSLFNELIKQDRIIESDAAVKHTKKRKRRDDDDMTEQIVDKKQAKRIFKQARAQLAEEAGRVDGEEVVESAKGKGGVRSDFKLDTIHDEGSANVNTAEDLPDEQGILDDEDRRALDAFFYDEAGDNAAEMDDDQAQSHEHANDDAAGKLSEILREKQTELESMIGTGDRGALVHGETDFETWKQRQSEQVLTLYSKVREVLARYRSGKLPKAFKIVPALDDSTWRHFLELLEPTKWTARAMFEATRLFSSNLNERRAEAFYRCYLLPRVRDDIAEFGKLNSHLFAALRRAVYKPAAFVKGILFSLLCLNGEIDLQLPQNTQWCTNREAYVFAAVLSRLSVPMLHAAAACVKLSSAFVQMVRKSDLEDDGQSSADFFQHSVGPFSLILRALVEKRYALPFRALASLVDWFVFVHSFAVDKRRNICALNVVWFQCFLAFVERYGTQLTSEQLASLLTLTEPGVSANATHKLINPAIRRVLMNALQHVE